MCGMCKAKNETPSENAKKNAQKFGVIYVMLEFKTNKTGALYFVCIKVFDRLCLNENLKCSRALLRILRCYISPDFVAAARDFLVTL